MLGNLSEGWRVGLSRNLLVRCTTTEDLAPIRWGYEFFDLLAEYSLTPNRVGAYEPFKTPYERARIPDFWRDKGIFAKGQPPRRFLASVGWKTRPVGKGGACNMISISFPCHVIDEWRALDLAKRLLYWSHGLMAAVSADDAFTKQYHPAPYNMVGALPGVYWASLYGPAYEELIPWHRQPPQGVEVSLLDSGVHQVLINAPVLSPDFENPKSDLVRSVKQWMGPDLFLDAPNARMPHQIRTGEPTWPNAPQADAGPETTKNKDLLH